MIRDEMTVRSGERGRVTVTLPRRKALLWETRSDVGAPAAEPQPEYSTPPVLDFVDLGTQLGFEPNPGYEDRREYIEAPSEYSPFPSFAERDQLRQHWFENLQAADVELLSGRMVPNLWPLQVNTDTSRANVSLVAYGPRGVRAVAVAAGAPHWHAPASIEDQADGIAEAEARRAAARDRFGVDYGDGIERWQDSQDAAALEAIVNPWGTYTRGRVDTPGRLRPRLAPGPWTLSLACPYNYRSWALDGRFRVTSGLESNYYSQALETLAFTVVAGRCRRATLYLAPQQHRIIFQYLAVYLIVGWFGAVLIYLPVTRSLSLRSQFWPEQYLPPDAFGLVNTYMSLRISRTLRFAEAVAHDAAIAFGLVSFFLVDRVQARFALYTLPGFAGDLAAVVRFYRGAESRDACVWRQDDEPGAPEEKLEVSGLYVPGFVTPWIPNYFLTGDDDITEGI